MDPLLFCTSGLRKVNWIGKRNPAMLRVLSVLFSVGFFPFLVGVCFVALLGAVRSGGPLPKRVWGGGGGENVGDFQRGSPKGGNNCEGSWWETVS